MHLAMVEAGRYQGVKPLECTISEYIQQNFRVTSSGMPRPPGIAFCQRTLDIGCVLYAVECSYQYIPENVLMTEQSDVGHDDMQKVFPSNAEANCSL